MTRAAEFYTMDADELAQRLVVARRELLNLRFQLATGQLDNVAQINQVRRDVARVLTVLREMEIAEAEGIVFEAPAPNPSRERARRRDEEQAALAKATEDEAEVEPEEEDIGAEQAPAEEELQIAPAGRRRSRTRASEPEADQPPEVAGAVATDEAVGPEEAADDQNMVEEPVVSKARSRLRRSRKSDEAQDVPTPRVRARRSRKESDEEQ